MVRVLGVHGVGNLLAGHPPGAAAEHLAGLWRTALATSAGQTPLDLRVAYYADCLGVEAAQGDGAEHLPADARQLVTAWATALGAPADVAQGRATAPIRHIVGWVARRYGLEHRLVDWFVGEFFREVAAYLREPDGPGRSGARTRVADLLAEHRPHVLIAHSLGSVVAYETLCVRPDLHVDLFITLGSPLGMPDVVHDRLLPADGGPPRRPPGVRRWVNVADVGDLVAVPPKLGGLFDVDVDHEVSISLFDFHRVRRYLASAVTGTAVGVVPDGGPVPH